MKKQWVKTVCIVLALVTLAITAAACPATSNNNSGKTTAVTTGNGVPVVKMTRAVANNPDLAGKTIAALATPGEGALLVNEGARIRVPAGAVAENTPVTLKVFMATPENLTSAATSGPEVTIVSNLYDLGPDTARFNNPVNVTLGYDESDLPAGADENNLGPVYWNGVNWIPLERQIDTVNNTISFETKSFPGVIVATAFGYAVGWGTITASGVAIVGAGAIIGYKGYKWWIKDPVYWGKGGEYVTPKDAIVQQYAEMSKVQLIGSGKRLDIKDILNNPDAVNSLKDNADADGYVGFIKFFDENNIEKPMTYNVSWNPNDWQKPTDFFSNGMVGDCKNVANGICSILRSYGYQAKCMDGYTSGSRHAWVEVKIGDQMFYVGSRGELMTLEGATKFLNLTRSVNQQGETFQWDENGQKPYKKNWWVDKIQVTPKTSLAFPGGKVDIEVFGAAGTALDIELTVEAPDKTTSTYSGTTDAATGKIVLTVPIKKDAPIGVYYATAVNKVNDLSEIGIFSVDTLEITAGMVSSKAAPGEDIGINVRLNYPLVAIIQVDRVNHTWATELDGTALLTLNVPENAELTVFTLTIRAPEYGVFTTVKYTVTVPPTLKVAVQNQEVTPGGTLKIIVTVLPPQVTRITVQGFEGRWQTDDKGIVNISLPIGQTTKPGQYKITAEAPLLELSESDYCTVTTTPSSGISLSDITVVMTQLNIDVDFTNDDESGSAHMYIGGQYVRSKTTGYEVIASGTINANGEQGEMYYNFSMRQDNALVSSGTLSLSVPSTGESYDLDFYNIPRNAELESQYKTEEGLDCFVFTISGTEVINHIRGLSVASPSLGSITRYFATENSELIVVLIAASEDQITQLIEEY